MAKRRRRKQPKQVETTRHDDKRVNIPTNELRGFVTDDEEQPDVMLYPRDPSLDPQLVWQGKDEQDRQDLAVPIVPIYIQEKIHPQAIIEEVKQQAKADSPMPQQMSLFDDFNGIDFEQLIEFYEHEQNWSNRMILGDSLQVMTSLAEKEGLKGKVQMIYLDPPYGIKFGSNWQVSTRKRDVKDGRESELTRQPEQIRAFRDTWIKGIHSYLAYLRDRLTIARELLTNSGSIFIQIGDENVHLVRSLLDETFGSDNFCSLITLWKTSGATTTRLASVSDYILWYAKDISEVKYRQMYTPKTLEEGGTEYKYVEEANFTRRPLTREEKRAPKIIPDDAKLFRPSPMTSQSASETTLVDFVFEGEKYHPRTGGWKTNSEGFNRLVASNRIIARTNSLSYMRYLDDFPVVPITNLWLDTRWGFDASERIYVVQTNVRAIQRCLLMTTDPGDIVLDPTMGSGTTAFVAEQWGRRWITVDTSRVAVALARTRLMSGRFDYYTLADSPEGIEIEAEMTGIMPEKRSTGHDIRKGFVYNRAPHIMLKHISRNEEIDEIHERWQQQIEPLRQQINNLLNVKWEEWEVPREIDENWQPKVKDLYQSCVKESGKAIR